MVQKFTSESLEVRSPPSRSFKGCPCFSLPISRKICRYDFHSPAHLSSAPAPGSLLALVTVTARAPHLPRRRSVISFAKRYIWQRNSVDILQDSREIFLESKSFFAIYVLVLHFSKTVWSLGGDICRCRGHISHILHIIPCTMRNHYSLFTCGCIRPIQR